MVAGPFQAGFALVGSTPTISSAPQPVAYSDSLVPYSMFNRVSDVFGLVRALGYEKVAMVVGHDWGGPTAQWCARLRPDVFRSVVSISTPFFRAPTLPLNTAAHPRAVGTEVDIDKELAALPRPRKHYATYCASREANENISSFQTRLLLPRATYEFVYTSSGKVLRHW